MIFGMFNEFGAMNSGPVFGAFQTSLDKAGVPWTKNINMCNVAVIWSVLWNGRMARNKEVWDHCKANNKPIIVLEVGGLQRKLLLTVLTEKHTLEKNLTVVLTTG
mgnify:CR=1 FL=1